MKLGSLFDGIGGFPLAATRQGITPVWASEIEAVPMEITKKHFPNMLHLGDVTKIDGTQIEPVDIITFGSPCQDLSVAGKRAGLEGERSGLFMEAVRIIRGMRGVTLGDFPRFAVWENVPGAFSSKNGEDFRAVLEELTQAEIPMPASGKWAPSGMVRTRGVEVAWRTLDAQYWGVPQRRKRIFLVADFRGCCAGKILFKPESMPRYITESRSAREEVARSVAVGAGESGECLTPWDVQSRRIHSADGKWPALYGGEGGGHGYAFIPESILPFDTTQITSPQNGNSPKYGDPCHPLCATAHTPSVVVRMRSGCEGGGKGALVSEEKSLTLATGNDQTLFVHPKITGTLCAGGAGMSRPAGMASETDLVVAYCIAGNTIDRKIENGGNGKGVNEEVSFTLNTIDRHAVAAIDCRNLNENAELSGTLQCKSTGGYSLNYQNPVRIGYAVRRLTPTECERLQGFPDGWTDGHSDTARYKALGNSVAVPCVEFVMQGIAEALRR